MANGSSAATHSGLEEAMAHLQADRVTEARLEYQLCCRSEATGNDQATQAEINELKEQLAAARKKSRAAQKHYSSTFVLLLSQPRD